MRFAATTTKPGPLAIHDLLESHAISLWVPDHLTDEQAAAFALDHFRRQVETELQMAQIRPLEVEPPIA
jgi:hypothetical protein